MHVRHDCPGQVGGYGRLGDLEPKHEQLAVDSRSTAGDHLTDICQATPAIAASALDRIGPNDRQACGPARPPPRQQDPEQSIPKTETGATSFAALQHPRSDGAARSFRTPARRGYGVRRDRPTPLEQMVSPQVQPIARSSKSPMNSRGPVLRMHNRFIRDKIDEWIAEKTDPTV